ncbi:MAG: hypothetical protein EZS28_020404 [Streblomastix strix]|uniref:Uncharacterized protein n=1 Tax=Streblomastix strix TaxID=222440 RepID=A0A5J4VN76_9EUKA|nr:MAG: hypothetical protein EZS28_020404 [Streblomastix strix]
MNNKANTGVSYTKGEDDALLLLKADKTQLIDSYTKIETNNLLNNNVNTGVSYTKGEVDALLLLKADKTQLIDSYTKGETNNLSANKADSGISYTKGETNNFLANKADSGISQTKGEEDTLLLLMADKTQLIDSYTKIETNNLLSSKAYSGVSYTKGEDNTLLLAKADKTQLIDAYTKSETKNLLTNKANQSTTYIKTETDYLISQIDVEDVDLTDYYNKTKTDELLSEKADATELSNYVTLGTSQTINANKTFNNTCRFTSTIDGMSTITKSSFTKSSSDDTVVLLGAGVSDNIPGKDSVNGSAGMLSLFARADHRHILNVAPSTDIQSCVNGIASKAALEFIKSGSDDTSVLLAGGGTKLISEFSSGAPDLSNYYTKTQTYSQTEACNKFVRLEGSIQQIITGRLKYVSPFGDTYDETQDPVANTYLTMSEVDAKLSSKMDQSTLDNLVNTIQDQTVNGSKTFTSNVIATGFAKTGKDDTSILLVGGGDMLLSAFGGLELVNINCTSNVVSPTSIMALKYYRYGSLINFYGYIYMGNGAGASGASVAVCTLESAGFPKYLFYADDIVFAGSAPHVANFRFGTDGKVMITIKALTGTAGLAGAASAYINVTYPAAN